MTPIFPLGGDTENGIEGPIRAWMISAGRSTLGRSRFGAERQGSVRSDLRFL
jgi:hypothetical protein